MIIFPAIDLSQGACVRLTQGSFAAKTVYSSNPLAVAREFEKCGAQWLHVVDLDGARDGAAAQTDLILSLAQRTGMQVQAGGGVRTRAQVTTLLTGGVSRVIVGSLAVNNPDETVRWLSSFGGQAIVLALDVRVRKGVPVPALKGWQSDGSASLWDLLSTYSDCGLRHVLCTDIDRDGTMAGPNIGLYEELSRRFPAVSVLASGGVSCLKDLTQLKSVGASGVIVGKALYERRFTLSQALAC